MMVRLLTLILCGAVTITSAQVNYGVELVQLTDIEYPDNPDIGYRATTYDHDYFADNGHLSRLDNGHYTLVLPTRTGQEVAFTDIDLRSWIPTSPSHLASNDYMVMLAVINQEWNRNQVAFRSTPMTSSDEQVVRVDLARNCLNANLWEVIIYIEEDGKEVSFAHAWFDFPREEYQHLYNRVNNEDFSKYADYLVNWQDPPQQEIDKDLLRTIVHEHETTYQDLSNHPYPMAGARVKKRKEIVTPVSFETMRDLQSDQTTFATFAPPGLYTRSDPRRTQLGRLQEVVDIVVRTVVSPDKQKTTEIELTFNDRSQGRTTHLILGGLDLVDMPVIEPEQCNDAWKSSMGFGNHTFYESYDQHERHDASASPYYAYFTDEGDRWLDSHAIGVDGPMIHWGPDGKLHVWLLSFERHAIVGHYALEW